MIIGNKSFETDKHTYIMGIMNVTPDSFSDGGMWRGEDQILRRIDEMIREGADIIDIGGESTRPGHTQITAEEEIERTANIIARVKREFDIPVSLDTYKSSVAEEGIKAGADMINDIWGLKYDLISNAPDDEADSLKSRMADLIAEGGVCCCLMHNRLPAEEMYSDPHKASLFSCNTSNVSPARPANIVSYGSYAGNDNSGNLGSHGSPARPASPGEDPFGYSDFLSDLIQDLRISLDIAHASGINDAKIVLDPGVGFAKNHDQNRQTVRCLEKLHALGSPVLLGASRKSFIGDTLQLPVGQRLEGTLASTAFAVLSRCGFVRVHDIEANKRFIRMMEAVRDS